MLRNCLPLAGPIPSPAEIEWSVACAARPEAGLRWLLPLLAVRIDAEGVPDHPLLPKLRAARLYEVKRRKRFEEIAAETIATISVRSTPVVSRGVVLATSAYPAPEARHLHDLDLIVEDRDAATAALVAEGYEAISNSSGRLRHASGMAVSLHSTPLPDADAIFTREILVAKASPGDVGGSPVVVPPRDMVLLHVILLASAVPGKRLPWAADAWMAVRHGIPDWSRIAAAEGPDAFWLFRGLRFLARSLDAPVPPTVLDRLAAATRRLGSGGRVRVTKRAASLLGRRALAKHAGRTLLHLVQPKR